jgi:stage V sporulation protein S
MEMIKVSANSRTSAVAGAIAGVIREHKRADVQAIGAGAVNQAVKALVLATGYLRNDGIDICCVPEFVDVEIEDKVRTAVKLVVEPRIPEEPAPESMELETDEPAPAGSEPTETEAADPEPIEPEKTDPDIF